VKVFVWRRLENLTDSYHSEGGAVAVAETLDRARELFRTGKPQEPFRRADGAVFQPSNETLPENSDVYSAAPDLTVDCDPASAEFIEWFPDAGCC
jgi:hypothetical protein